MDSIWVSVVSPLIDEQTRKLGSIWPLVAWIIEILLNFLRPNCTLYLNQLGLILRLLFGWRLEWKPACCVVLRASLFGLAVVGCGWLCCCAGKAAVKGKLLFWVWFFGNLPGCLIVKYEIVWNTLTLMKIFIVVGFFVIINICISKIKIKLNIHTIVITHPKIIEPKYIFITLY